LISVQHLIKGSLTAWDGFVFPGAPIAHHAAISQGASSKHSESRTPFNHFSCPLLVIWDPDIAVCVEPLVVYGAFRQNLASGGHPDDDPLPRTSTQSTNCQGWHADCARDSRSPAHCHHQTLPMFFSSWSISKMETASEPSSLGLTVWPLRQALLYSTPSCLSVPMLTQRRPSKYIISSLGPNPTPILLLESPFSKMQKR
jgi:hypothetical protein